MDHLGIDRFHLVGAKIGGTIARAFAARRPERVKTLTVVGTPPPLRPGAAAAVPALTEMFEKHGVEYWARQNMGNRLGSAFPPEGFEWWCKFMGRTAVSTQLGFMPTIACADIRADLPKIACPTLVITTEESGLGERRRDPRLATADPGFGAGRAARQFLPRRRDPRRPGRKRDARLPGTARRLTSGRQEKHNPGLGGLQSVRLNLQQICSGQPFDVCCKALM